jgi:hypothetical protein
MASTEYKKAYQRAFRKTPKGQTIERRAKYKFNFGTTIDYYEQLLKEQDGCCAICGCPETAVRAGQVKRLGLDHNHVTGQIRGLLCQQCNIALGSFRFDSEGTRNLRHAIIYWKKYEIDECT